MVKPALHIKKFREFRPFAAYPKTGMLFETYLDEHHFLEGNTKYILTIFDRIDRDFYQMLFASPIKSNFFNQISKLQCEYIYLPAPRNLLTFGRVILKQNLLRRVGVLLSLLYYNLKVYTFLRTRGIDFIQCHNLRSLFLVGLGAKLASKPVIWWVKGHLENPFLDRLGFQLADRILFLNRTMRDRCYPRLIGRYADKIRILSAGVDLQ